MVRASLGRLRPSAAVWEPAHGGEIGDLRPVSRVHAPALFLVDACDGGNPAPWSTLLELVVALDDAGAPVSHRRRPLQRLRRQGGRLEGQQRQSSRTRAAMREHEPGLKRRAARRRPFSIRSEAEPYGVYSLIRVDQLASAVRTPGP